MKEGVKQGIAAEMNRRFNRRPSASPPSPYEPGRKRDRYAPTPSACRSESREAEESAMNQSAMAAKAPGSSGTSVVDAILRLSESFARVLPIPKNATNTVYVEGVPVGSTEREVARNSLRRPIFF